MNQLNPAMAAYVEIRQQYFDTNPTKLSLEQLQVELMNKYDELPIREVALVFQLVKVDHDALQEKNANQSFRSTPAMKLPMTPHRHPQHSLLN